ncbi:MAG: sulfate respiration complex hexadecaheme cytochrome HmcA [Pseudomonadota bacterium]
MPKSGSSKRRIVVCALAFLGLILLFPSEPGLQAGQNQARPDALEITLPGPDLEMPGAWFLHDRHTEALAEAGKGCTACHQEKDGRLEFSFKGAAGAFGEEGMTLFHDSCIGCHRDLAGQGRDSGPLEEDCRTCHAEKAPPSSRAPFGMDRSLHFRHLSAPAIPPATPGGEANCVACHHVLDEASKKLVYRDEARQSCRYCHLEETVKEVRSFSRAAHDDCVNCHLEKKAANQKTGPSVCAGCHDLREQGKIIKVTDVPRLVAGQPDAVVVSGWAAAMNADPKVRPGMNLAVFDHKTHDGSVASCRECHHSSQGKCSVCHTVAGAPEGDFIRLDQAMHAPASGPSCIGCHGKKTVEPACAGCHAQMPVTPFGEKNCSRCHSLAPDALRALGLDPESLAAVARGAVEGLSPSTTLPGLESIPETVTIGSISDEYEPSRFPHRKIVLALAEKVKDSRLAGAFHKDPLALCAGCHHNSEPSITPPKCGSCHGKPFSELTGDRPGMKGAFHIQCITCHQKMGIEKPAATSCLECHAKKERPAAE